MRLTAALITIAALLWLAVQKDDSSVTLAVIGAVGTIALVLGADVPEILKQMKKPVVGS